MVSGRSFALSPDKSVLKGLSVNLNSNNIRANLTITNSSQVPTTFAKPQSAVYQYLQINGTVGNSTADNIDQYVSNATYNFSVPASWLKQQGISSSMVALFKYHPSSNSWSQLATTLIGSNSTSYLFSASSSSLSAYVVSFAAANSITRTKVTHLDLGSAYQTYFFAGAFEGRGSATNCAFSTNFITITSNEVCASGGGGTHHVNVSVIGYNTVLYGNLVATSTNYNVVLAGLGANVLFTNNGVEVNSVSTATATKNSLTYTVNTHNSVVLLFYALAGNNIARITLPTNGGCKIAELSNAPAFASAAVANCITSATGTYKTSFVANSATGVGYANVITAVVFPPYNVLLEDSPTTGNIITNGTQQANGNTIQVIGDNTVAPVVPGGDTFGDFSVDSANSANVILSPLSGTTNFITVLGDAILTATFTQPATCVPIVQNTLITFPDTPAGMNSPTANAENVIDSGTAASNILIFGVNWISSSNAFHVSNTLWDLTTDIGAGGTQLTNTVVDTMIPMTAGGSNVIFFGLNTPVGQAAGTYNQVITVEASC